MNSEPKSGLINCVFCKDASQKSVLALVVDSYFGEGSLLLAEPASTVRNVAVHNDGRLIVRSGAVAEDLIVPSGFCLEVTADGTEWLGGAPEVFDFIGNGDIGDIMATKLVKIRARNKSDSIR